MKTVPKQVRIIQDNPDADRTLVEEARKFERESKLPVPFQRSGEDYKQLKRTGNIALYEVCSKGNVSFEVIIIRDEKYPADMAFGIDAWQFLQITDAERCMKNEVYLSETE